MKREFQIRWAAPERERWRCPVTWAWRRGLAKALLAERAGPRGDSCECQPVNARGRRCLSRPAVP